MDCNAKFWRLIADILNDVANFLELIVPLFPPALFLPTVCSASLAKVLVRCPRASTNMCIMKGAVVYSPQAIVGTAGGATRAALVQHQARRDNMADVAAKDGSQVTIFFISLWGTTSPFSVIVFFRRQW